MCSIEGDTGTGYVTRYWNHLVSKRGDIKREIISYLDQHGVISPREIMTRFFGKYIAHVRSMDILIVNEKLDLLDMLAEKVKNADKLIE